MLCCVTCCCSELISYFVKRNLSIVVLYLTWRMEEIFSSSFLSFLIFNIFEVTFWLSLAKEQRVHLESTIPLITRYWHALILILITLENTNKPNQNFQDAFHIFSFYLLESEKTYNFFMSFRISKFTKLPFFMNFVQLVISSRRRVDIVQ